jgi:ubiquinone/menaquinone biosynthesis C-methylase UbiE
LKDYKTIWNDLGATYDGAAYFVCCGSDEDAMRHNGVITAKFLRSMLEIEPTDKVLEIGCGVGRVGRELAPHCKEWHGTDISGNMIAYAKERTADLPNVYLHELPDCSLRIFPDNSFDKVYSTIVFMHLDKVDMFTYMREAYRVLKPGGLAYFDTYNLLAPGAWQEFVKILDLFPPGTERPGHLSQFSTPQEFNKFMIEAGYDGVHVDGVNNTQLVVALGRKGDPDHPEGMAYWTRYWADIAAQGPVAGTELYAEWDALKVQVKQLRASEAHISAMFADAVAYTRRLEAEVTRKNAAIARLERQRRQPLWKQAVTRVRRVVQPPRRHPR